VALAVRSLSFLNADLIFMVYTIYPRRRCHGAIIIISGVEEMPLPNAIRYSKSRWYKHYNKCEGNATTAIYFKLCEGVSKSFRTDRLEPELEMIQLSATRCRCIAILWVTL